MKGLKIFVFGDQISDFRPCLTRLLQGRRGIVLEAFLRQAVDVIHQEIARTDDNALDALKYTTMMELLACTSEGSIAQPALESALLCIAQLARLIHGFEDQASPFANDDEDIHIVGFCTGSLAGAAMSLSSSPLELLPLAVETVRIAFRVGLQVGLMAERVLGYTGQDCWSSILHADLPTVQNALDHFHKSLDIATSHRLWISATSIGTVTITGTPQARERFLRTLDPQQVLRAKVDIYGPYHASHLFTEVDLDSIVSPEARSILLKRSLQHILHSSVTGQVISPGNGQGMFIQCLREILMEPVHWEIVVEELSKSSSPQTIEIVSPTPTSLSTSMMTRLKARGLEVHHETLENSAINESPDRNPRSIGPVQVDCPIAIVGLAGRFPDADDHEALWKILEEGQNVYREVPQDRFDVKSHTDQSRNNTSYTPYGNFVKDPGLFDAPFFHMSPREAAQTDPMQRLMLVTAYEAMEMGGIVPGRTPSTKHDRMGTFYGQASDDWREINAAQKIDTYFIPGGIRAFGPGRINYFFKFSGPSLSIDTACSSSFTAIHMACNALKARECDTALAGGANIMTNPDIFAGLSKAFFLSKTGACKTFDDSADGYCRGDGVATVILKRLDDAILDQDRILGVIRGVKTNHSANAVSITHPCAKDQVSLISSILKESLTDPLDINYVEMHGTGTQAGDNTEIKSVLETFCPKDRQRDDALYIGSVKANIGHGEAASGVSALIKCLLMLQKNVIPPHCGITTTTNRKFPVLSERNTHIARKITSFERPSSGKRTIFINNFSAAGGNTGLVIEDGPSEKASHGRFDHRPHHFIAISAKTENALGKNIERFRNYCKEHPSANLADLCYTTTARRMHYDHRVGIAASSMEQLLAELDHIEDSLSDSNGSQGNAPCVAFIYTGQGSQYSEMGRELYETCDQFREDINSFSDLVVKQGFDDFKPLIEGSKDMGSMKPSAVQLAIVCLEMALTKLWRSWGINPSVVVGHSLGEYAALHAAGILSEYDVIYLVGRRATLIEAKCCQGTHAMLAIKAPLEEVNIILTKHHLEVACINGPSDFVLSGRIKDITAAATSLATSKCKKLELPFAFHSAQVDDALDDFEKSATIVNFRRPHTPLLSPLLGEVIVEEGIITPAYLRHHCRNTVDLPRCLKAGVSTGHLKKSAIWLEIGSKPICSGMINTILSAKALETVSPKKNPWDSITNALRELYNHGVDLNFNAYHRGYDSSVLQIPSHFFEEKRYWLQYTGDWCLTKGLPNPRSETSDTAPNQSFLKTSVQRIISERVQGQTALVKAESNLVSPLLQDVISGHIVADRKLCPSSLYAEIALSLTQYAYSLLRPGKSVTMNIGSMETLSALIFDANARHADHLIQMEAEVDLEKQVAKFCLSSMKGENIHARCKVQFENQSQLLAQWQRIDYLVKDRIENLISQVHTGGAEKLERNSIYKLFGSAVRYSDQYQGMKKVILNVQELEGTSEIQFRAGLESGDFHTSPYLIDSVAHLAGFIMNASAEVNNVYVSLGWQGLSFPEGLDCSRSYRAYVKMRPVYEEKKIFAGDVYVFDSNSRIIGLVSGLKFRSIPKTLLGSLLGHADSQETTNSTNQHFSSLKPSGQPRNHTSSSIDKLPHVQDVGSKAISIIATELGIDRNELMDDNQWVEVGMDSLMCLAVCEKLREKLGLDIPSSLFLDLPTVGLFKESFLENVSGSSTPSSSSSSLSMSSSPYTAVTTPEEGLCDEASRSPLSRAASGFESRKPDIITTVIETIAEQTGSDLHRINDHTDLNALGMDSLMTLAVSAVLRDMYQINLPASTMAASRTLGQLKAAIGIQNELPPAKESREHEDLKYQDADPGDASLYPAAVSHLLQGDPDMAGTTIFLFPDGSGSATSYMTIPAIDPKDVCIFGLDCPFMMNPTSYTIGIPGVAKLYLEEILRRQPQGPYCFGGWSAGGIIAYEVVQQLASLAEKSPTRPGTDFEVSKLILIDSPCPIDLGPLPTNFHQFLANTGIIGSDKGNVPNWLVPHFEYSIRNLAAYRPMRSPKADSYKRSAVTTPQTMFIWATQGILSRNQDHRGLYKKCDYPVHEDDPESLKWLLEDRQSFGTCGWEVLINAEKCRSVKVDGADHFNMLKGKHAEKLVTFIRNFLDA